MSGPTPGPWYWWSSTNGGIVSIGRLGTTHRAHAAAVSIADARLIAAAPDLLEALQALIKYDVFVDQSVSQEMLDYVTAQVDARAAIAKATVAA